MRDRRIAGADGDVEFFDDVSRDAGDPEGPQAANDLHDNLVGGALVAALLDVSDDVHVQLCRVRQFLLAGLNEFPGLLQRQHA